jgi:hypothetical protein
MPAIAALGVLAASLVYPHLFAALASADLVAGAFAACLSCSSCRSSPPRR